MTTRTITFITQPAAGEALPIALPSSGAAAAATAAGDAAASAQAAQTAASTAAADAAASASASAVAAVQSALADEVAKAAGWAEGTEPGGAGTKSAKGHAQDAAAHAAGYAATVTVNPASALRWAWLDSLGRAAMDVLASGAVRIRRLIANDASISTARIRSLRIVDDYGRSFCTLRPNERAGIGGTTDSAGRVVGDLLDSGKPRQPYYPGAARYAGALMAANTDYTLECRQRLDGSGGHDIWRISNRGGGQVRLTPAADADYLNPAIVQTGFGTFVTFTRRTARRVEVLGVPIEGGDIVPLHSGNRHLWVGDSYTSSLAIAYRAADPLTRRYDIFATGGCQLIADHAALLGGTVATSTIGNSAGRTDGTADMTSYTDNGDGTITYPGYTRWRDRTLLLVQGQLEINPDIAGIIQFYKDIIGGLRAVHKRAIIMQAAPAATVTPTTLADILDAWAAIKADPVLAPFCLDTYDFMRANGGGGTVGSGGAEVWSLNNYGLPGDAIHMSATGNGNLAALFRAEITARNW